MENVIRLVTAAQEGQFVTPRLVGDDFAVVLPDSLVWIEGVIYGNVLDCHGSLRTFRMPENVFCEVKALEQTVDPPAEVYIGHRHELAIC